jgi:hypothetical protein
MKVAALIAATLLSGAAFAAEPSTADVGRFVYDQRGEIVGGLTAIGQGRAAVSDGLPFDPGYRVVSLPASALTIERGRVVLTGMSAAELHSRPAIDVATR